METLGFNQAGAVEPETALSLMLRGLFENALLSSRRCGENPDFPVGKNAIDIEDDEFNFAGTSGGRWFAVATFTIRDESSRPKDGPAQPRQ